MVRVGNLAFWALIFVQLGCENKALQGLLNPSGSQFEYSMESTATGKGTRLDSLPEVNLFVSQTLTVYAIKRAQGEYIENMPVTWSLEGSSGNLTVSPSGKSAIFTGVAPGSSIIKMTINEQTVQTRVIVDANPSTFMITGVTGGGDSTLDSILANGTSATIHWNDTNGEDFYEITLYEDDGTTIACATQAAVADQTSYTFAACPLTRGQLYQAQVKAVAPPGGADAYATNDYYSFIVSPDISITGATVGEGVGTLNLTVSLSHVSDSDISFNWSTTDNTAVSTPANIDDFTAVSSTLGTILAGNTSTTVSIAIQDDAFDEPDQSFFVNLLSSDFAQIITAQTTVTLTDNDAAPSLSISNLVDDEGNTFAFIVNRSERSEYQIDVDYATSNGTALSGSDYLSTNGTLSIPAGTDLSSDATISIPTTDDATTCEFPAEDFTLTLSNPVNASIVGATASGFIEDNNLPSISISSPSVTEGSTLTFNVSLDFNCSGGAVSFDYLTSDITASSGSDYDFTNGSVTITDPMTTGSFTVNTNDDSHVERAEEKFFVFISNVSGARTLVSSNAIGTIQDNEGGTGVAKVVTSDRLTCALSTTGDVKCWGGERYGALGVGGFHIGDEPGEMGDNLPKVDLGTGVTAKKIVRGRDTACVITNTDQIKCWGSGYDGTLGYGDSEPRGDNLGEMGDNLPEIDLGTDLVAADVSVADGTICAIVDDTADDSDDGKVKCWGGDWTGIGYENTAIPGNAPGEMGDALGFIDLGTGRTAKSLHGGPGDQCAILDNDLVKCWGRHLGDEPGEMGDNLAYLDLGTGRTAVDISRGFYANCVLLDNGGVKCWGPNGLGQLGQGNTDPYVMGDATPEIDLGTGRTAVDIASGYWHNCALRDDGSVVCWGNNSAGALGIGNSSDIGDEPGEMGDALIPVDLGTGRTAISIQSGESNTCAILDNNLIKCWGNNQKGGLGLGHSNHIGDNSNEMGDFLPTVDLGTGRTAVAMGEGGWNSGGNRMGNHNCALLDNGDVKCWGGNRSGHLGIAVKSLGDEAGEMGMNLTKIDLGTGRTAQDINLANDRVCALLDNNDFVCWGAWSANSSSFLPTGSAPHGDVPGHMGDNLTAFDFGGARYPLSFTLVNNYYGAGCAILNDFTTKCWGLAAIVGTESNSGIDAADLSTSANLDLGRNVFATKISMGEDRACALLNNGKIKCWGDGRPGIGYENEDEIGDDPGEMGDDLPEVDLGAGYIATDIALGRRHICATLSTGALKCWGAGADGANGSETGVDIGDSPGEMGAALPSINLGTGRTVKKVFAGVAADHSCALLDNDDLKCWGLNASGQLGLGDTVDRGDDSNEMGDFLNPVSTGTGLTVTSMSLGGSHSCAIMSNASLKCWGSSKFGQLGYEDYVSRGDGSGEMGDLLNFVDLNF